MTALRISAILGLAALTLSACVTNRTVGRGFDDGATDVALRAELLADKSLRMTDVDITVFEGRVLLTGSVPTMDAREALSAKTRDLPAAKEVLNEVRIGKRTSVTQGARDAIIDQKLGTALLADNGVFAGNYRIAVSDGTVYILGVAQGPEELARVTSQAQQVDGVKDIVSHVIFVGDPRRKRG